MKEIKVYCMATAKVSVHPKDNCYTIYVGNQGEALYNKKADNCDQNLDAFLESVFKEINNIISDHYWSSGIEYLYTEEVMIKLKQT